MSLIGYVTLEEANLYIQTHYISKHSLRVEWESLSDEDRSALLAQSFQTIELLPFAGRKYNRSQPNAFPRWPSSEVPDAIKWAQIENALIKCDASSVEDAEYYERLWMYGVESYSIGNLSEKTSSGTYGARTAQSTGVTSAVATRMLEPFLGGGYRM